MPLTRERLIELRTLADAESMAWGDVADLQGAFEEIPESELPEPAENAGFHDMLDELESRLRGVTFSRAQIEAWAGRTLTDDEVETLEDCAPNSSIPDAFGIMADSIREDDEDEPATLASLADANGIEMQVARERLRGYTMDHVSNFTPLGDADASMIRAVLAE